VEIARAYVQASLVDRKALAEAQEANDVMAAHRALKAGFLTDVSPILAEARIRSGGAYDPIAAYRASGYRDRVAMERPEVKVSSSGIF
jgi:L-rhamnose isomerase / sugar isomerase